MTALSGNEIALCLKDSGSAALLREVIGRTGLPFFRDPIHAPGRIILPILGTRTLKNHSTSKKSLAVGVLQTLHLQLSTQYDRGRSQLQKTPPPNSGRTVQVVEVLPLVLLGSYDHPGTAEILVVCRRRCWLSTRQICGPSRTLLPICYTKSDVTVDIIETITGQYDIRERAQPSSYILPGTDLGCGAQKVLCHGMQGVH
jgi:hypothetical protein